MTGSLVPRFAEDKVSDRLPVSGRKFLWCACWRDVVGSSGEVKMVRMSPRRRIRDSVLCFGVARLGRSLLAWRGSLLAWDSLFTQLQVVVYSLREVVSRRATNTYIYILM